MDRSGADTIVRCVVRFTDGKSVHGKHWSVSKTGFILGRGDGTMRRGGRRGERREVSNGVGWTGSVRSAAADMVVGLAS